MTDIRIRGRKLQAIRKRFLTNNPLCVHCAKQNRVTPATQIDHIVAIVNGGKDRDDNRQGLCDACHSLKTADDMGWRRQGGCDESGMPNDPRSHWNSTVRKHS